MEAGNEPGLTSLYLADGGKLSPKPVSGGSVSFPPQAKLSIVLMWLVGTWESEPLGAPVNYAGNINFTLWARASTRGQLGTRFQVYFGINGARGPTAYPTNSVRLGTTPAELTGTATNVNLKAGVGDTITFMVYVSERGSGGELDYGSDHLSGFELNLWAVGLNLSYVSKPGALKITGETTDIWGNQDIDTIHVGILGLSNKPVSLTNNNSVFVKLVSLDPANINTEGNQTNFNYTWKYDATRIMAGTYYVYVWVTTFSNSTAVTGFTVSLRPTAANGPLSGLAALAVAVVIIAAAAGGAVFYHMRRGGRGIGIRFRTRQPGTRMMAGAATEAGAPDARLLQADGTPPDAPAPHDHST